MRNCIAVKMIILFNFVLSVAINDHIGPLYYRTFLFAVRTSTLVVVRTVLFASASYHAICQNSTAPVFRAFNPSNKRFGYLNAPGIFKYLRVFLSLKIHWRN